MGLDERLARRRLRRGRKVRLRFGDRREVLLHRARGRLGDHKNADRGRARVLVGGVKAATVDLYSPTAQTRVAVFSKTFDAPGGHTLEVWPLRAKNPSSPGKKRVDVDAFVVVD